MDSTLKTAHEWLDFVNDQGPTEHTVQIIDEDGWRRGDGVVMETLITLQDFNKRLSECTVSSKGA